MATFIATTLTKRTGATTTVFSPSDVDKNGWHHLLAAATYAQYARRISIKSDRVSNGRRAFLELGIPQVTVDADGKPTKRGAIMCRTELYVPDGALLTDVDDVVGYLHAATNSSMTNIDDFLVNGVGAY